MTLSRDDSIANEIVTAINAAADSLAIEFVAKRSRGESVGLEKLSGARVLVIPTLDRNSRIDRSACGHTYSFVVIVERKLSADPAHADTEADEVSLLREQIADLLDATPIPSVGATPDEIVTKLWDEKRNQEGLAIFRQALQVTYPPLAKEGGA